MRLVEVFITQHLQVESNLQAYTFMQPSQLTDATIREIRIPTRYHPPCILQPRFAHRPLASFGIAPPQVKEQEGGKTGKVKKQKKAVSKPFSLSPAFNPTLAHLSYIQ
jgi:hypothetical protein